LGEAADEERGLPVGVLDRQAAGVADGDAAGAHDGVAEGAAGDLVDAVFQTPQPVSEVVGLRSERQAGFSLRLQGCRYRARVRETTSGQLTGG